MASKRKLWSTVVGIDRTRHDSRSATYRYIQRRAEDWQLNHLRSATITVYVDERDGQGWQTYERVDLREIVASWQTQ